MLCECPECEKKISDSADFCPYCGLPDPFDKDEFSDRNESSIFRMTRKLLDDIQNRIERVYAMQYGTPGLIFEKDSEGFLYVDKYVGDDKTVVIPSVYHGESVTGIGYSAFRDDENIETVIIEDGINDIGDFAFIDCTNLQNVFLPLNTKVHIGYMAFSSCKSIKKIFLSKRTSFDAFIFDNCKLKYIGFGGTYADWRSRESGKFSGLNRFHASDKTHLLIKSHRQHGYVPDCPVCVSEDKIEIRCSDYWIDSKSPSTSDEEEHIYAPCYKYIN